MRKVHLLVPLVVLASFVPGASVPAEAPRDELSVVTLNLWHDQHDWPARLRRIVRELRALDPDVICLQEVLQHETLSNQAAVLAESLGCRLHFTSVDPEGAAKRYGNAILSRHRFARTGAKFLLPLNDYRTVAHARIEVRGREVDIYDTHLHHTGGKGARIRAEQVADLLAFVDSTHANLPRVLAGDFNCELGSRELRPLERAYRDAFAAVHPRARRAEAATWNATFGGTPRAIDHVFVPRDGPAGLAPVAAEVLFRDAGPDSVWASDHFGVLARLRFAPRR